jgi:ribonuclease R
MSMRFTKRLMSHIQHQAYEPSDVETLARDLGVAEDELDEFGKAVQQLAAAGQVVWGDDDQVTLPPIGRELIGVFKRNPKGFGFVIPKQANAHGDLFVPAHQTLDAMSGDVVRAAVIKKRAHDPKHSPYVGEITEIITRAKTGHVGELIRRGNHWMVLPDGKELTDPIIVHDAESKNANLGDKVAFEITAYPEGEYLGEGVITRVLGESGLPNVETAAIIESYNLPEDFPKACHDEARELSLAFDDEIRRYTHGGEAFEPSERLDLRDAYIITIDPPDAKDYDDAISLQRLDEVAGGGRGFRLGIHIADVANFVTPGSALDDEARDRCNSVYLPRLVIPMLPEILSNGICSLQEGVPRYCKSVFIDYDARGVVRGRGYAATVIESAKRCTYLEAQALIDGDEAEAKKHAKTEPNYTDELKSALADMNTLSRAIRERRRGQGMIHLDLPDVELIFDDQGHVVDAEPEDDAYTHTLIEMFMVEANEALAALFGELEIPILRRVHPDPAPGDMGQLRDFVKVAGFRIPKQPTREELQALLDATAGSPAAPAIHFAVLRTLTKAEYSPALIGHFALASEGYAHFTSPIRRYPDLTVHRALTRYLQLTENGTKAPRDERGKKALARDLRTDPACPDAETLQGVGGKCNMREQNATDAERELRQFLVLQLLAEHIGDEFHGIVTGSSNAGVFVRLDKYLAEGLIKSADLPSFDRDGKVVVGGPSMWRHDREAGALIDKHSGRSFNIGDRITITILAVDLQRRQMDLGLSNPEARASGKAKQTTEQKLAGGLRLGDMIEDAKKKTGSQRRSQKSKSRDKRKGDFRAEKKGKGKRQ